MASKKKMGRPPVGPYVERMPTVMLPDGSLEHLKAKAAADGISFAELVRRKLGCTKPKKTGRAFKLKGEGE
jgi:hypothetical protein